MTPAELRAAAERLGEALDALTNCGAWGGGSR